MNMTIKRNKIVCKNMKDFVLTIVYRRKYIK